MKESYVKNVFLNVADADKTSSLKLLDMNGSGRIKIFSVFFIPASSVINSFNSSKITLWDSDPAVSGQTFYQNRITSGTYNLYTDYRSANTLANFSPGGLVVECNDIYAQGGDDGICFVSITYQGF
jgi:hypothetical protein